MTTACLDWETQSKTGNPMWETGVSFIFKLFPGGQKKLGDSLPPNQPYQDPLYAVGNRSTPRPTDEGTASNLGTHTIYDALGHVTTKNQEGLALQSWPQTAMPVLLRLRRQRRLMKRRLPVHGPGR
jgi:hypothetical protein